VNVTTDGVGHRYVTGGVVTLTVWSAQMTQVCDPSAGSEWTASTSGPVAKYAATTARAADLHHRCARSLPNMPIRLVTNEGWILSNVCTKFNHFNMVPPANPVISVTNRHAGIDESIIPQTDHA